jgi:hypothetical protein
MAHRKKARFTEEHIFKILLAAVKADGLNHRGGFAHVASTSLGVPEFSSRRVAISTSAKA